MPKNINNSHQENEKEKLNLWCIVNNKEDKKKKNLLLYHLWATNVIKLKHNHNLFNKNLVNRKNKSIINLWIITEEKLKIKIDQLLLKIKILMQSLNNNKTKVLVKKQVYRHLTNKYTNNVLNFFQYLTKTSSGISFPKTTQTDNEELKWSAMN